MRISITLTLFLLICLSVQAQDFKLKKVQTEHETYHVRKADQNVKEGPYSYSFDGLEILTGQYSNNKRSGQWVQKVNDFHASGPYQNGLKEGLWTFKLADILIAQTYYTGGEVDSCFGYFSSGKRSAETYGATNGPGIFKSYYENGQLSKVAALEDGKPSGKTSYYYEDGQLFREVLFKDGDLMTLISTFDTNGKALEGGNLTDGSGTYITYDLNDAGELVKVGEMNYADFELNGEFVSYNTDGTRDMEGVLEDGNKVGTWLMYEKGKLSEQEEYSLSSKFSVNNQNLEEHLGFTIVEHMPSFPGMERSMYRFLGRNVQYPAKAVKNGITGKIYVRFLINEDGMPVDHKVVRGIGGGCDEEALRVTKLMPFWSPGISNGRPVKVQYTIPIVFQLN